jgi:hypothetical protein
MRIRGRLSGVELPSNTAIPLAKSYLALNIVELCSYRKRSPPHEEEQNYNHKQQDDFHAPKKLDAVMFHWP